MKDTRTSLRWSCVLFCAALILSGCSQPAALSDVGGGGTPPSISDADARALMQVVKTYVDDVREGRRREAVGHFLPDTSRTAEAAVSRDMGTAQKNPDSFVPSEYKMLWLDGELLMPKNNDNLLMQSERDRLGQLSEYHKSAVVVFMTSVNGTVSKRFVVQTDEGFYLVP